MVSRNCRYIFTLEQCQTMAREYESGLSSVELARRWGTNFVMIIRCIRRAGGCIRSTSATRKLSIGSHDARYTFSLEQCQTIAREYASGVSTVDLAERWRTNHAIINRAIRHGGGCIRSFSAAKKLIHPVREDAFNEPLGEEALYWLGFLMADGCITGSGPIKHCVTFGLAARDHQTVERLRVFLGCSHPVRISKNRCSNGKDYETARFSVMSARLVEALARYGIAPRKSLTAEAKGGVEHNRHFWRGVIDGDGSVAVYGRRRRRQPVISLIGSRRLVEQFIDFAYSIAPTAQAGITRNKSMWGVKFTDRFAQQIVPALYDNCVVALPRKLLAAQEVVEWTSAGSHRQQRGEYRGVYPRIHRHCVTWRAIFSIGKKNIRLGNFDTPEEAARAYDAAAREHFGDRAILNFPDVA
jgi:hypothetical protein